MEDRLEGIIGISVGAIVAAVLVPIALQEIATANLTGVTAALATLFTVLLSVMIIVSTVLYFLPRMRK